MRCSMHASAEKVTNPLCMYYSLIAFYDSSNVDACTLDIPPACWVPAKNRGGSISWVVPCRETEAGSACATELASE